MWNNNLSVYSRTHLLLWLSLSFQAGFINVGGFLACHRFVTHTTGFATQFGAEFAGGHWPNAFGMLTVPLFFLAGAMFSAFFVDRRVTKGKSPRYTLLIGTIAGFLLLISAIGSVGLFGRFGAPMDIRVDYFLLAILCMVSGIQNATITSASGAVLRTTHLTGLTTDLGIGLVRLLSHDRGEKLHKHELQSTRIRLTLIGGFITGSTLGASIFLRFQYNGFFIPALVSGTLWVASLRKDSVRADEKTTDLRRHA